MRSKIYLEDCKTNKKHQFGEAEKARRLWTLVETDTGEFIKAAFTMNELKRAVIRAQKNPEDE